jgi:diguanylate cyclase (GGDEF)-like protein
MAESKADPLAWLEGDVHPVTVADPTGDEFLFSNSLFRKTFPSWTSPAAMNGARLGGGSGRTLLGYNQSTWEALSWTIADGPTVTVLKDVSNETGALRKIREQLKGLQESQRRYESIFSANLPLGIVVIDAEHNVHFANGTAKKLFRIPSKANLPKCYNFLKRLSPCDACLLSLDRAQAHKKAFSVEGAHLTGELIPSGDSFVYLFRDTTREVELIGKIKEQQEDLREATRLISEQNEILKRLSALHIRISQIEDVEKILEVVATSIADTFDAGRAAILLNNEVGKIEYAFFSTEIPTDDRELFVREILASANHLGAYTAADYLNGYLVIALSDERRTIGKIFLHNPQKIVDRSILDLFAMQLNSHLENARLRRRLEEIAHTDGLTGVFNRYYFDKRFAEEKESSRKYGQPLSLIMIDINGLKEANDRLGHKAGDTLIQKASQLLRENISVYDSIYRFGGDEFLIMLSNCGEDHLRIMIEMLREGQQIAHFEMDGQTIPIRFSLGGGCSSETDYDTMKELADQRMYQDKMEYYKTHPKYR